jgi:magnesium transporter
MRSWPSFRLLIPPLLSRCWKKLPSRAGTRYCRRRRRPLGEFRAGRELQTLWKEGLLGLLNGGLVGISAGIGMLVYAWLQGRPDAWLLGVVVWLAMIGSCIVSGISGALVPLALRRLGADPATASSIFLTTATDVISMGLFLGLATILV